MLASDVHKPPRGAYCELADLIALRFPAGQLKLSRRKRALNMLAGSNKTNFRGRGIDFEEVRYYQPGDDIRTIDWRVTARTGDAHTKLFREERERPVLVVTDQRDSMFFGSRHCFKSVLAAHLSSLLAWSALENGDRIGGVVFNGDHHHEVRPRRSRKTVLALLSELHDANHSLPLNALDDATFADMLSNLRRIARPGSSIFMVSDFRGADNDTAREYLFRLAQHTEITAIRCSDPLEGTLPRAGRYAVTDGSTRSELHTADTALRQRFEGTRKEQQSALARDLQRLGIPLIDASTDESPLVLLQTYYGGPRR